MLTCGLHTRACVYRGTHVHIHAPTKNPCLSLENPEVMSVCLLPSSGHGGLTLLLMTAEDESSVRWGRPVLQAHGLHHMAGGSLV